MSLIDDKKEFEDQQNDDQNLDRMNIEGVQALKQIQEDLSKIVQYLHIITGDKL